MDIQVFHFHLALRDLDFREKLTLANTESNWEAYITVGGFGHGCTGCVGPIGRVHAVGQLVLHFILFQLRDQKKHISECLRK